MGLNQLGSPVRAAMKNIKPKNIKSKEPAFSENTVSFG
jgi:hypothetical protein